jgi:prepilin-type N-terminal cleavage/methylation domain-containing protein
MNRNGFTLLEVLIALTLLAISFTGIFFLLNQSLDIERYSKDKTVAILKGYEKVIKYIDFNESLSDDDENNIKYEMEKKSTMYPSVSEVHLKVINGEASQTYVFYESR